MEPGEKINILGCCGGHEEHIDSCAQVEFADLTPEELDDIAESWTGWN